MQYKTIMKKLILLFLLVLPSIMNAQRGEKIDKEIRYLLDFFQDDDEDFMIKEAPAQFKNEPVVILCQKIYVTFEKDHNKYGFIANKKKGIIRKRVIIQDKSALDYYSEYYYKKSNQSGISLIKPDGTVQEIDFDDAVEVSTDVPSHYRNNYSSGKYYKIAIPNLEVGDIVDSYEVFKNEFNSETESGIYSVSKSFPVVHQEYVYDVSNKWTFYINNFNGAPDINEYNNGLNSKGKKSKDVIRYSIVDKNRPAQKEERWDFKILSEPTIKYMVADVKGIFGYARYNRKKAIEFNVIIGDYLKELSSFAKLYVPKIKSSGETGHIKKLPTPEKVVQIYNLVKYYLIKEMVGEEKIKKIESGNVYPFSQDLYQFRSDIFTVLLANMLSKYNVDYDMVVITPKQYGFPEDVVSNEEFEFGVYVPETDRYYWVPNNYTLAGELSSNAFGASGYKIYSKNLKFKEVRLKAIELPESKFEDHVLTSNINITMEEDNTLTFDNTIKYSGYYKESFRPFLLYNTAYAYDEVYNLSSKNDKKKMEVFNGKKQFKKKDWRAKNYAKKRAEQEEELKEYEDQKFEYIKNWIEDEFKVKEINSFEVITFGNESYSTPLECTSNFTSDAYVKKAGPNLIFDMGMLISEQVQLDTEEIETRTKPIEMLSARTIKNIIAITIPEGMVAEGIDALNFSVDNEAAAFISSVTQEGNIIKINTEKIYKQEFLEKTKWPQLVEMLEAAFQFTQQKVVLKKS